MAYIFDVWARVNRDNIAVLDAEIVPNDTIHAGVTILQVVIGQHNQNSVLSLLALDQYRVATEELEGFHIVIRERNDRVVIVDGVGDTK